MQGAIFDMDGLMFDTEKIYRNVWDHLPEEFGFPACPGLGEAVCGTSGEDLKRIVREHIPGIDADAFMDAGYARVHDTVLAVQPDEKPGLHEIIGFLKARGFQLAVASGSPQEIIELNIKRAGLTEAFGAVVSGFCVPRGKPAPDIFLESARRIGCDPGACYVFEDGANGIRAGAAAGCVTVMIPDLTAPDEELRALCAGIFPGLLEAMRAIEEGRLPGHATKMNKM
ncbi:HAD family hydrolase [Parablautia sp. Marseille-Q6255]|uniref:HAD family hydrolase n=1 Tax=Parablautia sp. Marseille-Q6255 TaxID=3039593 RepID=UPI0024BCA69C|nr:HAD family phosphatase [Parablautia sp. Marseille-Q6255]